MQRKEKDKKARERSSGGTQKILKFSMYKSVLFFNPTPGGVLAKELRQR